MNILIAGATGFIGRHLVHHWCHHHKITVVGRSLSKLQSCFPAGVGYCSWEHLPDLNPHDFDIIINLSGYNIGAGRWTEKTKQAIIDSRVSTTNQLINWAAAQNATPHFYCANAVGIYGLQQTDSVECKTEEDLNNLSKPTDFLAEVGLAWRQAAENALSHSMKLTIPCFGVVLKRGEGMLKQLALPYSLGLGSIIGSGKQMISWVHIKDIVNGFDFLINQPDITGLINLCAPNPVSQKVFSKSLATAMHRPCWLKTPAFVIRLLFGEMGECLILKGQAVMPKRLQDHSYVFKYPTITEALEHEFRPTKA